MPKGRKFSSSAARRIVRRGKRSSNRTHSRRTSHQRLSILRRLVLFPNSSDSTWLSKLSWFASIALKLLTTVIGVTPELEVDEAPTGAGTTMILGAGDFASFSPFATSVLSNVNDKEVVCLKTFPFERASMHSLHVRIIPSADVSVRGGMFAALLIPIDSVDLSSVLSSKSSNATDVVSKYSSVYDDLIKHPRAKMGPVTSGLELHLSLRSGPHDIRIVWDDSKGFCNMFPTCALLVAFSDLAAKRDQVTAGYSPAKSLFEVHARASLGFHEPSELAPTHNKTEASMSCYTPKILTTSSTNVNTVTVPTRTVCFFDKRYEVEEGKTLSLFDIPQAEAKRVLEYYDRGDLLSKLTCNDFEIITGMKDACI